MISTDIIRKYVVGAMYQYFFMKHRQRYDRNGFYNNYSGVFLILAARNPLQNLSLIWFTVWSSIVHGAIMAVQSIYYPEHLAHLLGDVPALFIVAILLGVLTPRGNDANPKI